MKTNDDLQRELDAQCWGIARKWISKFENPSPEEMVKFSKDLSDAVKMTQDFMRSKMQDTLNRENAKKAGRPKKPLNQLSRSGLWRRKQREGRKAMKDKPWTKEQWAAKGVRILKCESCGEEFRTMTLHRSQCSKCVAIAVTPKD